MIKVTALALALTVDPMSFKVISVPLRQNTITVALSLVPLTFVDILVRVDHPAFSLGMPVYPVSVVAVAIRIEEGAAAMSAIFIPVASILAAELSRVISPESTLSVFLIDGPHSFIFVSVLVILDTEAFLAVVAPVSDVARGTLPLFAFDRSVFLLVLLLDPVD